MLASRLNKFPHSFWGSDPIYDGCAGHETLSGRKPLGAVWPRKERFRSQPVFRSQNEVFGRKGETKS